MGHTQNAMSDKISKEVGISRQKGREFLRKVLQMISDDIIYTGRIELKGIGVEVDKNPPQTITHPETGEIIHIPEKKILRFRSSKTIKNRLNPDYKEE